MPGRKSGAAKQSPSVVDSWKRIEAWLDIHLPVYRHTLKRGISDTSLAKFEKAIGSALPDDVRESWLIHDGQRLVPDKVLDRLDEELVEQDADCRYPDFIGLIFGNGLLNLLKNDCEQTCGSALEEWKDWAEIVDEGYDADLLDKGQTSSPKGAIRTLYANRGWIPLGAFTDTDYFGVDLDPGPKGVIGQVINFGRNEREKCILGTSWRQFLSDVADELEAGNFVIDLQEEHEEFLMRRPRRGTLRLNYKEWSKAKLAGKML